MMKLLAKEWKLCMHPTGYIMLLCAALILVPGYPYAVCCFYMGLAIFFICLTARENHDAAFTLTLPVSRRDAAYARILFCSLLEAADLLLMAVLILLKQKIDSSPNPAGLDAGLALIGEGLIVFAIFNMIFFPVYYRDVNKPGKAFVIATVAVFGWVLLEVIGTYTIPFFRDVLDKPDPLYMGEKALFTLAALALFLGGTALSAIRSAKRFETLDMSL